MTMTFPKLSGEDFYIVTLSTRKAVTTNLFWGDVSPFLTFFLFSAIPSLFSFFAPFPFAAKLPPFRCLAERNDVSSSTGVRGRTIAANTFSV